MSPESVVEVVVSETSGVDGAHALAAVELPHLVVASANGGAREVDGAHAPEAVELPPQHVASVDVETAKVVYCDQVKDPTSGKEAEFCPADYSLFGKMLHRHGITKSEAASVLRAGGVDDKKNSQNLFLITVNFLDLLLISTNFVVYECSKVNGY